MESTMPGYYCIIQYTPDRERAEGANVGVLLFSPGHSFLDTLLSSSNSRVQRFFGPDGGLDLERVQFVKESLRRRLRKEAARFRDLDDLVHFVLTRANHILLTAPRPVMVADPRKELDTLYRLLVENSAPQSLDSQSPSSLEEDLYQPAAQAMPAPKRPARISRLNEVMGQPGVSARVERNVRIFVPVVHKRLVAPYAYRNGALNLIYPKEFSHQKASAMKQACQLAAEGHLIARHKDPRLGAMRLVVVPEFAERVNGLADTIEEVFREHDVRFVRQERLDVLAEEIIAGALPA